MDSAHQASLSITNSGSLLRLTSTESVISPLFSSSLLDTYQPGEFIFQCHIFLPFHTVHRVLKARILKWFAIPFSSGPCFIKILHHDPFVLAHSFTELDKAVVHVNNSLILHKINLVSFNLHLLNETEKFKVHWMYYVSNTDCVCVCVCVCVYTGYWHITVIAYCESLTVKKWLKTWVLYLLSTKTKCKPNVFPKTYDHFRMKIATDIKHLATN